MEYKFLELAILYVCAIVVPGPSTALLLRNGIVYSRATSISASCGIILGTLLQTSMILLGIMYAGISDGILNTLKIVCSFFLIFLGLKSFYLKKTDIIFKVNELPSIKTSINNFQSFIEGFLIEVLNPLALIFFLSILLPMISTSEPSYIQILYLIEILILGSIWFCGFAFLISSQKIILFLKRFSRILDTICGLIFILFGSKLLITNL